MESWFKPGDTPGGERFATPPYSFDRGTRPPNPLFTLAANPTWSADGLTVTWRIPISDEIADGAYNKRSNWQFTTMPDDLSAACRDAIGNRAPGAPTAEPLELGLTIRIERLAPVE